jgi:predicted Zn-dependent protease
VSPARSPSASRISGIRRAVEAAPALEDPAAAEPAAAVPTRPPAPRPAPRTRRAPRQVPVRTTLDLAPELHAYLRDFARQADVVGADVMRELLRQLRADPELAARVEAELWRRREVLREARRQAQE